MQITGIWRKEALWGVLLVMLLWSATAVSMRAELIAYVVPAGTQGTHHFDYPVGMDFCVHTPIYVTSLGAFDHLGDGLNLNSSGNPIRVSLWQTAMENTDPGDGGLQLMGMFEAITPVELAFLEFGGATGDGALVGGSRFKDLAAPLLLNPGRYTIVEEYASAEGIGNPGVGDAKTWYTDDGGGALSFLGFGRYANGQNEIYPGLVDIGPADRYAAGTFGYALTSGGAFAAAATVPEPATMLLLALGLSALVLRRR
jgi:hypothetical protein